MTLRNGLIAYATVAFVLGIVLIVIVRPFLGGSVPLTLGIDVLISGAVCGGAVAFERSRYRPQASAPERLRPTGEKMNDPVTNELVEVWEDPMTGEREYRAASGHSVRK